MQIPHEVSARPDTGLYNAKVGIWLFLASEVMLFGGLFSAYLFLRLGAEPGHWPHGLLNVPVGTMNTFILIASSVTVVLAWASLKMRNFRKYQLYMAITILCGVVFLVVKLAVEWPEKSGHFGVYLKKEAIDKYEQYLGNEHLRAHKKEPRIEITGHLHGAALNVANADPAELAAVLEARHLHVAAPEAAHAHDPNLQHFEHLTPSDLTALRQVRGKITNPDEPGPRKQLRAVPGVTVAEYELALDPANADPKDPANERPHFIPHSATDKVATILGEDVQYANAFGPWHSSYFATYFTITGLHGLHVLGGVLVFGYFVLPTSTKLYRRNPEHLANRVEVAGLFWHFVDLVWIFVFPIFYLL